MDALFWYAGGARTGGVASGLDSGAAQSTANLSFRKAAAALVRQVLTQLY